jgi:zinc transport system ATP-binding protein
MSAIKVDNLSVSYPGSNQPVIEGVSFEVKTGTMVVIVGPNGSGKSTLIKAILGLLPYEGQVKWFGTDQRKKRLEIGYVAQRFAIDRSLPMTVAEFLRMALVTCVHKTHEKGAMITKALDRVGLPDTQHKMLSELSGGQLQRLLLARALVHTPKLVVLDEPEAGVDAGGEQVFYQLLEKLVKEDKTTVVMVSHELGVVRNFADMVLCINRRMICQGRPDQVLTPEVFEQLYGTKIKFYHHHHQEHQ